MTENRNRSSLQKLPKLVQSIENNRSIAYAHFRRLAFLQLVYISSGGPGGGSPTDDYGELVLQQETDNAIDLLQSLLDQQQEALGGAGGNGGGSGAGGDTEPCQGDLALYQAALAAKDLTQAAKYLDAYTKCMASHSGTHVPIRPVD